MSHAPFRLTALAVACMASAAALADTDNAHVLETVEVQSSADASKEGLSEAFAGGQVAEGGSLGILGKQDSMATPYSFTNYTELLIEDQQAESVADILMNDPAVRVARGFGNFQQLYLVRGLPVYSDDMSYNGLYGLLPRQYLASEFIQRVQVFRGANAFLNGAAPGGSGLGGAVNVLPKRAPNYDVNQFTLGVQSGGQAYGAVDLARRSEDGRAGIRLNAARRDGDTAVDGENQKISMSHIGVDFREENLRISADLGFQKFSMDASMPSITFASGVPIQKTPDADKTVAQPWTYSNSEDLFGTVRAEYDFADNVTTWVALGGREGKEDAIFANPTVINTAGDYTANRFDNVREDTVITGEAGVRWSQLTTGPVTHTLSLSTASYELESKNAYLFGSGVTGNIYGPTEMAIPPAPFAGGNMDDPGTTIRTELRSVAFADQLSMLNDSLLVTLGGRYQEIEDTSYDYNTGNRSNKYEDNAVTPSVGLLYRLTESVSLYSNYIEGLVAGGNAPADNNGPVANAGETIAPFKTEQAEIGMKFDAGNLGGSVSLFQSEKPITGFDSNNKFEIVDDQTNRGLELMAYGKPLDSLTVLGGVSLLDTDVDGEKAIGSPDTQANLNVDWAVPGTEGLSLDGRIIYTSSQYVDAANTAKIPDWTRLDLGARYLVPIGETKMLTLRARVENVADTDYWASAGGYPGSSYLTVGAPRTVMLSGTYEF